MSDNNLNAAIKAASQVKSMVASLRERQEELEQELVFLRARNDEILTLPITREEQKHFIFDYIDHAANLYLESGRQARALSTFVSPKGSNRPKPICEALPPYLTLRDIDHAVSGDYVQVEDVLGEFNIFQGTGDTMHVLSPLRMCFFFGDAFKRKIEENFDALIPFPTGKGHTGTISIPEKRAALAANLERIRAIGSELQSIRESLSNLSVKA